MAVLQGGGSAPVAGDDLWGPCSSGSSSDSVLRLGGGRGMMDHGGDGEVAETVGAAAPQ
jgi:hypothetical protein